jgi:uncharacterized protein (DUF4415 family)
MSVKRTTAAPAAKRKIAAQKRPVSGTDWDRLRKMTDAQAERGAAGDAANPPAPPAWLTAGRLVEPTRKQAISLRLDPEVVDWFRNTGPRYQSRMNAVLRAFVEHQARIVAPTSKRKRVG